MVLTRESVLAQWCRACKYKDSPEVCDECRDGSRFKESSDDMVIGGVFPTTDHGLRPPARMSLRLEETAGRITRKRPKI